MPFTIPGSERFEARTSPGALSISPNLPLWSSEGVEPVDPVTYEVIAHKLERLQDEYAATIAKVSGSVLVTEAFDYNVALADERGSVFSIGRGSTLLGAVIQDQLRWTLENRSDNPGIEDGDVFLANDPWVGGTHQPDTFFLVPIFIDGKLFSWAASGMHLLDVGGPSAPMTPSAKSVFEEAVVTPPIKLVRNGVLQRDVEDMFIRHSKLPMMVTLDLRAMVAAANVATARMHELAGAYGADLVHRVMKQMMDTAEEELRARLRRLPDGVWRHQLLMESSGPGDRDVYQVTAELRKSGDEMTFDFTDADPQRGFLNATASNVKASAMCSVLPTLCTDLPWSTGAIERVVKFEFAPGTIAAAQFPSAISGGPGTGGIMALNVTQALVGKMLSAGPEDLKRNLMAVTSGSMPLWIFHGPGRGGVYTVVAGTDCLAGGGGGNSWRDGGDLFGWTASTGVMFANVESLERAHPLLYLYRRESPDGGGPGRYRGGTGGEMAAVLHGTEGPLHTLLSSWGFAFPTSSGLNGGLPAKSVRYVYATDTDVRERLARGELPNDCTEVTGTLEYPHMSEPNDRFVGPNDMFHMTWSGGGGYGDPMLREPERVLDDVIERLVAPRTAREIYGVVLDGDVVDESATRDLRAALRGARIGLESVPEPPAPTLPADAVWLDENLVVLADGSTACARCDTSLAGEGASFKAGATCIEPDLLDLGLVYLAPSHYIDEEIVFRQFVCPGCGTLLECEVARRDAPPLNDRMLTRASMPALAY